MYYIDYHCHSSLSPDSETPLEAQVEAAIAAGLSEFCITDHYDTLTIDGKVFPPHDWAPWVEQYHRVKEQYQGKMLLKFGVEFGCGHLNGSALETAPAELDFVLGSVHNYSLEKGGGDFYYGDYKSLTICQEALADYVNSLALLVESQTYDVLAHLVYPLRYMERAGHSITLDGHRDQIAVILKRVIETGRGLELNTYNGRTIQPWTPWLELYKDLGGEIITVGSDAHVPENLGKGIPEAYQLLESLGYRWVTTYQGRAPRQVGL